MIVYSEEDVTAPAQPVKFRCPEPCNEKWNTPWNMLEHTQQGHPDLYWYECSIEMRTGERVYEDDA